MTDCFRGVRLRDGSALSLVPWAGRSAPGREGATTAPRQVTGHPALCWGRARRVAPRLTIRDAGRLRDAHPGASDEEIAKALVARAARLTAAIGAAAGGLSAAHWFVPGSLLALPLRTRCRDGATEGVEVVLVGELHELYGQPAAGDARSPRRPPTSPVGRSSGASRRCRLRGPGRRDRSRGLRALRRRLGRKLAGACRGRALPRRGAMAGRGNRRATETLARRVRADLPGTAERPSLASVPGPAATRATGGGRGGPYRVALVPESPSSTSPSG